MTLREDCFESVTAATGFKMVRLSEASKICVKGDIDINGAGPGFYSLAAQLTILPNTATPEVKLVFWSRQVGKGPRSLRNTPPACSEL